MARKSSTRAKESGKNIKVDSVSSDPGNTPLAKSETPRDSYMGFEMSENPKSGGSSSKKRRNITQRNKGSGTGTSMDADTQLSNGTKENVLSPEQFDIESPSTNSADATIIPDDGNCNISKEADGNISAVSSEGTDCNGHDEVRIKNQGEGFLGKQGNDHEERDCFSVYLLRYVSEWMQRQRPLLIAVLESALQKKDYFVSKFHHVWPQICNGTFLLRRVSLLLFVLWLDCFIRGLNSMFRLGTASFLVVIWCTIFNIVAMEGVLNILIAMGISCGVAFFLGYSAAVLTATVLGMIALYLHGSIWLTGSLLIMAGIGVAKKHDHLVLLLTVIYSLYSTIFHVGWIGMAMCMNLSFVSSDIMTAILKSKSSDGMENGFAESGMPRNFTPKTSFSSPYSDESQFRSEGASSQPVNCDDADSGPSTSGTSGGQLLSAEEEVIRLLDSADHYAVLGFSRYQNVDLTLLKREYRKKAMLVHPDKNRGNEKAEEAFKKLQNAYEILLDTVKRKIYDDELRREELITHLRSFGTGTRRYSRYEPFQQGNHSDEGDGVKMNTKRIVCKKCRGSHNWIEIDRTKAQARWCQECQNHHPAKDGDGWFEQSAHAVFFGMIRKVDLPRAYACVDNRIYDATEWVICQGLCCPSNTHKPTFHVNTAVVGKEFSRGSSSSHKFGMNGGMPTNLDENMTEEEFFDWFQEAVEKGMFHPANDAAENSSTKSGSQSKSSKKKRKGKKQW